MPQKPYDKMTKKEKQEFTKAKKARLKELDALDPSRVEARRQAKNEYERNRRTLDEYRETTRDAKAEYMSSPAGQRYKQKQTDKHTNRVQIKQTYMHYINKYTNT